ncbi:unnamed protein product, partial [Brassica rapa]
QEGQDPGYPKLEGVKTLVTTQRNPDLAATRDGQCWSETLRAKVDLSFQGRGLVEQIDVVSVYGGDVDTRLRAQDRNGTNLLRVLIEGDEELYDEKNIRCFSDLHHRHTSRSQFQEGSTCDALLGILSQLNFGGQALTLPDRLVPSLRASSSFTTYATQTLHYLSVFVAFKE